MNVLSLSACLLGPLLAASEAPAARQQAPRSPEAEAEDRDEFHETDWRPLHPKAGTFTKLRLVIYRTNLASRAADIATREKKVLEDFERAFSVNPLRLAMPSDGSVRGGWGCMLVIGRLEIETIDGSFHILIQPHAFGLNGWTSYENAFWSGYLAETIDALFFSETNQHLPNIVLRQLSGYEMIHVKDEWLGGQEDNKEKPPATGGVRGRSEVEKEQAGSVGEGEAATETRDVTREKDRNAA